MKSIYHFCLRAITILLIVLSLTQCQQAENTENPTTSITVPTSNTELKETDYGFQSQSFNFSHEQGGLYFQSEIFFTLKLDLRYNDSGTSVLLDLESWSMLYAENPDYIYCLCLDYRFTRDNMVYPTAAIKELNLILENGTKVPYDYGATIPPGVASITQIELVWEVISDYGEYYEVLVWGANQVLNTSPSSIGLDHASEFVNSAVQHQTNQKGQACEIIIDLLEPYQEEESEYADLIDWMEYYLETNELAEDEEFEVTMEELSALIDQLPLESVQYRNFTSDVLDRATHLSRTMPIQSMTREDAQYLANMAKLVSQSADDFNQGFPARASSSTNFLSALHGIVELSNNIEDPDAREIIDGIRDITSVIPGMDLNPLTSTMDISGEIAGAMINVSKEGYIEAANALDNVAAAIAGDPTALEAAIRNGENLQRILSGENYGNTMLNSISDRFLNKIPFIRPLVEWLKED